MMGTAHQSSKESDLLLLNAEHLAAKTIDEYGIRAPEDIRVRDIAFALGAMVIEQQLNHAAASIVRIRKHATIRISPSDNLERKRFSISHELGHLVLDHVASIQKVCTHEDMTNWYQNSQETQANFFASELVLPKKLLKSQCDVIEVNFNPIIQIAKDFRTSLTATAIKFVRLCPESCAVVYSSNGKIKWFYKSPTWWPFIRRNKKLDKRTLAYDFFNDMPINEEPAEIDGDAWVENGGIDEIVEHSISSSHHRFVLSILWIRPN